jgi:hypothetical protein
MKSDGEPEIEHTVSLTAKTMTGNIGDMPHSPWPTERPEGWGAGCWFRFDELHLIAIGGKEDMDFVHGLNPVTGQRHRVYVMEITAFGPKVEVPR